VGFSDNANADYTYTASTSGTHYVKIESFLNVGRYKLLVEEVGSTPAVTAAFTADVTSGEAPLTVNFTDESTGATSWSWDFDNDGVEDATSQNPSYTYDTEGTYTVSLEVGDGSTTDTETKLDYITVSAASGDDMISSDDDDYSGAIVLQVNETATNKVDETEDMVDWFKIELAGDKEYELVVEKYADDTATAYSFYVNWYKDPAGNSVFTDYVSFDDAQNEEFTFSLSSDGTYYIEVEAYLNAGRYNIAVNETGTVGLNNASLGGITVYPNPAKDIAFLQWPDATARATVKVFSSEGTLVISELFESTASPARLNLENCQPGLYFLEITQGQAVTVKKLIIK
jgi:hypothetical protein